MLAGIEKYFDSLDERVDKVGLTDLAKSAKTLTGAAKDATIVKVAKAIQKPNQSWTEVRQEAESMML